MGKAKGIVKAVCISEKKGIGKSDIGSGFFIENRGIENDVHAGNHHKQISLLSEDKIKHFNSLGADVGFGDFGENLVVEGIDFGSLYVGTLLKCSDVVLEISQVGKECHHRCQIYDKMGDCIMPREGVFACVLKQGTISVGDVMEVDETGLFESTFRAAVLTISDKGAKNEREDESGVVITTLLKDAGYKIVDYKILPDEQDDIEKALRRYADRRQVDLILTTGGTGFSVRDVTPEATLAVAERNAPGIAEAIRAFSMQITGRAMLSRGASVIRGRTLIINLPGSPKAVRECLNFVLPQLSHGIDVLRGSVTECAKER